MQHGEGVDSVFGPVLSRLGWLPSIYTSYGQLGIKLMSFFRDDLLAEHGKINPFSILFDRLLIDLSNIKKIDRVNQALYLNSKVFLPNQILAFLGDRMEMAHSVEGRLPFLDRQFAEFAASIPLDMKINKGCEKYILREVSKDVVIPQVYRRQKHPFSAPTVADKRNLMMSFYYDILTSDAAKNQPVFDQKKSLSLLDNITKNPQDQRISDESNVQFMVSVAIMHEKFGMTES